MTDANPGMLQQEFTFGGVACLIVTFGLPATAHVYQIDHDGQTVRPLADRRGHPIELVATQAVDAMGRAVRYLEARYGAMGAAPGCPGRPDLFHYAILDDQPIVDERPEELDSR